MSLKGIKAGDKLIDESIGVVAEIVECDQDFIPPKWARLRDVETGDTFMEPDLEMANWSKVE